MSPDHPLTVKEYAALFRVTENGVYIAIRKGRFPHRVERPLGEAIRIYLDQSVIQPSVDSSAT